MLSLNNNLPIRKMSNSSSFNFNNENDSQSDDSSIEFLSTSSEDELEINTHDHKLGKNDEKIKLFSESLSKTGQENKTNELLKNKDENVVIPELMKNNEVGHVILEPVKAEEISSEPVKNKEVTPELPKNKALKQIIPEPMKTKEIEQVIFEPVKIKKSEEVIPELVKLSKVKEVLPEIVKTKKSKQVMADTINEISIKSNEKRKTAKKEISPETLKKEEIPLKINEKNQAVLDVSNTVEKKDIIVEKIKSEVKNKEPVKTNETKKNKKKDKKINDLAINEIKLVENEKTLLRDPLVKEHKKDKDDNIDKQSHKKKEKKNKNKESPEIVNEKATKKDKFKKKDALYSIVLLPIPNLTAIGAELDELPQDAILGIATILYAILREDLEKYVKITNNNKVVDIRSLLRNEPSIIAKGDLVEDIVDSYDPSKNWSKHLKHQLNKRGLKNMILKPYVLCFNFPQFGKHPETNYLITFDCRSFFNGMRLVLKWFEIDFADCCSALFYNDNLIEIKSDFVEN